MNKYISVLSGTSVEKNITLTFTAINNPALAGQAFSITVSPLNEDTAEQLASKIYLALQAELAANSALLAYSGIPSFFPEDIAFTFRVYLTGHILSIWSQCQFLVTAVFEDPGDASFNISILDTPVFPLIQETKDDAPICGVPLVTTTGEDMTDAQIQVAIEKSSAQLVAWLHGFNVVMSTYLHSETGQWWRGFMLRFNPVLSWDSISVNGPVIGIFSRANGGLGIFTRFDVDEYTGNVEMLDFSNSIGGLEVGDFGHNIRMTYAAGFNTIPEVLKTESIRVLGSVKSPIMFKSIEGGRGKLELKEQAKVIQEVLFNLQEFTP